MDGSSEGGPAQPSRLGIRAALVGPVVLTAIAHLAAVLWIFQGPLLAGSVPFFRDICNYYYPNYVFLSRAFDEGVWPLWNPTSDAGAPFLLAEPLELALVYLVGPLGALRLSPPLHVFLAMAGASQLARTLGRGTLGAITAGTVYGLSGFLLSAANLFELFHAACWAPALVAAFVGLVRCPSPSRAALLAVLATLQVTTLSGEIVLQTALVAVGLAGAGLRAPRTMRLLLLAGVLTLLLCAPLMAGAAAFLAGTARAQGMPPSAMLVWSAPPPVLLEAVLPRFLGDVHTYTDRGFWGQSFFPYGYPYFLSLYLGPAVLLLASRSRSRRLWVLAVLGAVLSLGEYGPLRLLLLFPELHLPFRNPVKFFFLTAFAASLMAAEGVEAAPPGRRRVVWLAPGLVLLAWAAIQQRWPGATAAVLGSLIPPLHEPRALEVAHLIWPAAFLVSGTLALGSALALLAGRRWMPLAVICAGLDLAATNGSLNPSSDASFFDLEAPTAGLVRAADNRDPERVGRWLAYGVTGLSVQSGHPAVLARNRDVSFFHFVRQTLLPRTHVLDGLEAVGEEDRIGFQPPGAPLTAAERNPTLYRRIPPRVRLAGVRWLLGFAPLREDLVEPVGVARLPELAPPLRLYAVRDALPRAFWVPGYQVVPDLAAMIARAAAGDFDPRSVALVDAPPDVPAGAAGPSQVTYERRGPHEVVVRVSSPPGIVVILDGYHDGWRAEADGRPVRLLRANGRYRALVTPGGDRHFRLRYQPAGIRESLAMALLGVGTVLALVLRPRLSRR
jgi:hypothetical protein